MPFSDDLRQYGPDASSATTLAEARAYCARLTATHYENFSVVTWLTPRPLRPAFRSIYAFCRWSDDLGDEVGDKERSKALLAWWRGELASMYESGGAGKSSNCVRLAQPCRFDVPVQSLPVSPPPITITCLPVAKIWSATTSP